MLKSTWRNVFKNEYTQRLCMNSYAWIQRHCLIDNSGSILNLILGIISQHFTVCFSPISLYLYQKPIYVIIHLSPSNNRTTEFAEKCYCKLFFFLFPQVISLALAGEGTCVGICPLRKVKGAAGIQNHLDLGFFRFSVGLWRHKKSGGLICRGGELFATDTRYTVVLRMFFVMGT